MSSHSENDSTSPEDLDTSLNKLINLLDSNSDEDDDEELEDEDEYEEYDLQDLALLKEQSHEIDHTENEEMTVEQLFLKRIKEKSLLPLLDHEDFKILPQSDRIKYAVVAAWGNYNTAVQKILEEVKDLSDFWETFIASLSIQTPYAEKFVEHLENQVEPENWKEANSFDPLNKKVTKSLLPFVCATSKISDHTIAELTKHDNGFSRLERLVLQSAMAVKPGTRSCVMGILIRAIALNHEQWTNQIHPLFAGHTVYDVWKALLNLKGYTAIDFWIDHYSKSSIQELDNRALVNLSIEILLHSSLHTSEICGIKKDTTSEDIIQWLMHRANEQDIDASNMWWNEQCEFELPTRIYKEETKKILHRIISEPEGLSNPLWWSAKDLQHPILDFLEHAQNNDWIENKDVIQVLNASINWNMYPNKEPAKDLTRNLGYHFLKCHSNAPNVSQKFIEIHMLPYLLHADTSTILRSRMWNTLWEDNSVNIEGPLNAAETKVMAGIVPLPVHLRWERLCSTPSVSKRDLVKPDDLEDVESQLNGWAKKVSPQTLQELQSYKSTVENTFKKFKVFEFLDTEHTDQRMLFTEEDVEQIIPDLQKFKKSAEIFAFWEDFFKKNPSGLRRSARAQAALKNINRLRDGFPHFEKIVEMIESDLALAMMGKGDFFLPPMIMDGPPGTGKTFFFNELARISKNDFHIFNMESVTAGPTFTGLDRMWSNTAPGELFEKVIKLDATINPIILLDELDKCATTDRYPVAPVLLSLLEPHSAKKFLDRSVPLKLDLSRITWVATSNNLENVSLPIRSRFRVVDVPSPNLHARIKMSRTIEEVLRRENAWGSSFKPVPHETLQALCAPSGSARDLRKNLMHGFAQAARAHRSIVLPHDLPTPEKTPAVSPWNTVFEEIPQHLLENK